MGELELRAQYDANDRITCLGIKLSGRYAHFPSNCWGIMSNNGRGRRWIGYNTRTRKHLDQLTTLYELEAAKLPHRPNFEDRLVYVSVFLCERQRRVKWDSHNQPKVLCDWLERVGIVNDDTAAECHPWRMERWNEKPTQTVIYIQEMDFKIVQFGRGLIRNITGIANAEKGNAN